MERQREEKLEKLVQSELRLFPPFDLFVSLQNVPMKRESDDDQEEELASVV